jgi:Uma2 family endonuclease
MNPFLQFPDFRSRALPITVETYHWMIANDLVSQRAELIRGVIVEKMSKTPLHGILVGRIYTSIQSRLPDDLWLRKEEPLSLRDSEPEPEISLVSGCDLDYLIAHPHTAHLVVEVSIATETQDRAMIKIYAEAGVQECWLVLGKKREIEVYTQPQDGVYKSCQRFQTGDTLVSQVLPKVSVVLADLFPLA